MVVFEHLGENENQEVKDKRIVKNSLYLYVRLLVVIVIGLYTSRVTLNILGVEDYGIYNLVAGIIVVFSFVSNAMALSISRFLAFSLGSEAPEQTNEVFSMSVNIHILWCFVIVLLGETLGLWFVNSQLEIPDEKMFVTNVIYQTSIVSFVLQIMSVPYNSEVITHECMDYFALTSIIQNIGRLLAAVSLFFINDNKLLIYALLMIIPNALYFSMNMVYALHHFSESIYKWQWSTPLFLEMASFAGYSTFGNMATAVVNQGQSVLLNIFYGSALNAVRGLALQVNTAILSFSNGIYTAVNPQITKSYAEGNKEYFLKLVYSSTIMGYFMLFMLALPLFLEANFMLSLWLYEVPEYTVQFVRLILINSLVYNFVTPSWMAIQATGSVAKVHLWTGSINLCNILFTYIIWNNVKLEPYTMLVINILVSFAMQVATVAIQRKLLPLPISIYISKVVHPILMASTCAAFVPMIIYLSMDSHVCRFACVCLSSLVCCPISFYMLSLNGEQKFFIRSIIKRYIIKR